MTYPQTNPPPPAPAYPATVPGRRRLHIECQPIGISRDMVEKYGKVEGLQETAEVLDLETIMKIGKLEQQYPQRTNEEMLEFLADLRERQRLLLKGLFLLKNIGSDL